MPQLQYHGRPVQLSYSTNVHPARSLADVRRFLARETSLVRAAVAGDRPFGVCLHLSEATLGELRQGRELDSLAELLVDQGLEVVAINGFPLGDFHAPVVKEQAYSPDWTQPSRKHLTIGLAEVFARLLPPGGSGTISTLAGSYKPWGDDFTIHERMAEEMIAVAGALERLEADSGRHVLLGLEPEPFTTLETTAEVLTFFDRHLSPAGTNAGMGDRWRRHVGLNLDLCHQAVEFEDLPGCLDALHENGIRIGSVHAAAALRVPLSEPGAVEKLAAFAEDRYLHQLVGVDAQGTVRLRARDLPEVLARAPAGLAGLQELRCHFHVPLGTGTVAGLPTTAEDTAAAVRHALDRDYCRAIVAETYTWGVGPLEAGELAARLAEELNWLIQAVGLTH